MFGKIVDGRLVLAGKTIKIKNGWITNPTEEQLLENGYKEVVIEETQKCSEGEKNVEVYTDTGKNITISYTKTKLSEVEERNDALDSISKEDILKAIIGDKESLSKIEEVVKKINDTKKGE